MVKVNNLQHGGIMPNYKCTAACRHCLYACDMDRTGGFMSRDSMDAVCESLIEGGCRSVHIGGGEPFLDFDGLLTLLKTAKEYNISVEYIETNGYWSKDENTVKSRLNSLAAAGSDTLCISVDPFHAEYIPYAAPIKLAKWCKELGFGYFLWQERFLAMLENIDAQKAHTRASLESGISKNYIQDTARAYGLSMGGRAINIEEEYYPRKPVEELTSGKPCRGLLSGNHFHVDMYNRFIPPGCTGIAIPMKEAVNGIPAGKYPAFEALLTGGVKALMELANKQGFIPDSKGYTSTCGLCFHIRHWLSKNADCPELDAEHYMAALRYY